MVKVTPGLMKSIWELLKEGCSADDSRLWNTCGGLKRLKKVAPDEQKKRIVSGLLLVIQLECLRNDNAQKLGDTEARRKEFEKQIEEHGMDATENNLPVNVRKLDKLLGQLGRIHEETWRDYVRHCLSPEVSRDNRFGWLIGFFERCCVALAR